MSSSRSGISITVSVDSVFIPSSLNSITQYGSTCIVGIMEVWGFCPKISSKNQLYIYYSIVWHNQAQKCLQINPKPFHQDNFYEISYLTEFYTN